MTKKTILLTGVSGVLGKNIVTQILKKTDYNIIGLTANISPMKEKFNTKRVLLLDRVNWFNIIDKKTHIDTFINCGFPRTSDPTMLTKGIEDTEILINNVIKLNVKNIINISSQSVYSQKKTEAATELTEICPESLYGMTKYSVERIIDLLCKQENINYSHIRLGSLVSLDFKNRMTYRFVELAFNNKPLQVKSSNLCMSYLHVDDATNALLKMLQNDSFKWKKVYNLGNSEIFKVDILAELIEEKMKLKESKEVEVKLESENFIHNNTLNSSLFSQDFDWRATVFLKDMIEESYEHIKDM